MVLGVAGHQGGPRNFSFIVFLGLAGYMEEDFKICAGGWFPLLTFNL